MQHPTDPFSHNLPVLLSIPEVCKAIGLGRATVFKLIRDGKLSAVKIQSRTVVRIEELRAFIENLPVARTKRN